MMKKAYYVSILLVIYLLTLGIRVYWLTQKSGLHCDEGLSLGLTYNQEIGYSTGYPVDTPVTGATLKELIWLDDNSIKGVLSDVYTLWQGGGDGVHTNFYFTFLRFALMGLKSADMKQIIYRGGALNLVFFSIAFFVFFFLIKYLFKDNPIIQFAAVFCAFMSPPTISAALFMRPYQLQSTMLIVFTFAFYKSFAAKKDIVNILLLAFLASLTLLSGYLSGIFIGLFGLYTIYYYWKQRNPKEILPYLLILAFAFVITRLICPTYFVPFTSGLVGARAEFDLSNSANPSSPSILQSSLTAAMELFHRYYFTMPVLIVLAAIIIYLIIAKNPVRISEQVSVTFCVALLFAVVTFFTSQFKILRYSWPAFSFFILLFMPLLSSIKRKNVQYIGISLLCLAFVFNAVNEKKIEYLFKDMSQQFQFTQEPDVPVIVAYLGPSPWLIPYIADDQIYVFTYSLDTVADAYGLDDFYVITSSMTLGPVKKAVFEQQFTFRVTSDFDFIYNSDIKGYDSYGMRVKRLR
jgi:hypothetical protein